MSASNLLRNLLDYVLEQDKDIDPRGFKLSAHKGFLKAKPDLQGLPGVDFDIKVQGDHVWLRIARLEAKSQPALPDSPWKRYIVTSDDLNGTPARIDEPAFNHFLAESTQKMTTALRGVTEAKARVEVLRAIADYSPLWTAWAEGEKPRRKTISLYGDLFALKHQLGSEETAKPHELVWGVGVAAWKLNYEERTGISMVDFQYSRESYLHVSKSNGRLLTLCARSAVSLAGCERDSDAVSAPRADQPRPPCAGLWAPSVGLRRRSDPAPAHRAHAASQACSRARRSAAPGCP